MRRIVEQPGIQLLVALHPQPWGKEALPHQPHLVLDLPLLPARCRCAGHRIDEIMAAHLHKAAIVGALATNEDRLHRRLHVVVDAPRAGALEEGECPVVGVEHHLLRLARIRPREQHPAVAQPDMRHLHRHRRAVDQHDLMAPVELIRLARCKAQRNEGTNRGRRPITLPPACIAPHRIIAALVAKATQLLEYPDQRQPLAAGLRLVRRQNPIKRLLPRTKPRQWLLLTLVAKLRRLRTQNLPNNLPRNIQLTADRLDRSCPEQNTPAGSSRPSPQPASRSRPPCIHGSQREPHLRGVPFGRRYGVPFARRLTADTAEWAEYRINATTYRSYDTRRHDKLNRTKAISLVQAAETTCARIGCTPPYSNPL